MRNLFAFLESTTDGIGLLLVVIAILGWAVAGEALPEMLR